MEEQFIVIILNRVLRVFTVMAPVGQKILELCKEKSSKHFGSQMRQLSLEINHSCSSTRRVPIFFQASQ